VNDDDIAKLSRINAAQAHKLAMRLAEAGLIDLNDGSDEEVGIVTINDASTGEVITAIDNGVALYWEQGTTLIEQLEAAGRIRYRTIEHDVRRGKWQDAPPPPSRAAGN
jgi:hypothetical protein